MSSDKDKQPVVFTSSCCADKFRFTFECSDMPRLADGSLEAGEDGLVTFRLKECSCGRISGGPVDNCWYCGKSLLNGIELALKYLREKKHG